MSKRTMRKQTALPVLGLDTSKPAEWISDQNTPNCQNVDEFDGQIRKSYGFAALGAQIGGTNKPIMSGIEFKRDGVTYVMRIGVDIAEKLNTATGAWASISAGTNSSTVTDEMAIALPFLSGKRIAVFTSAAMAPQKWTGTGNHADLGGSPPKAKYCEAHAPYTLLAHITDDGGSAYSTRVQWPDTGDPENWSTGNSGYKDLHEGGDITGLKKYGNYTTVHKRDRLYLGYLVQTSSIYQFDEKYTPGTICNASIQNLPNGSQVYLAIDGIRLFNGSTSTLIDSPINTQLRDTINLGFSYRAWSIVIRDLEEYWIGIPISGSEYANVVFRFNYTTGQIFKRTFIQKEILSAFNYSNISSLTWADLTGSWETQTWRWNDSTNVIGAEIAVLNTADGYSMTYDKTTTNDLGLAVDSIFESKDYFLKDYLGKMVRWNKLELWAKGESVKVSYSTDKGNTWTLIEEKTLNSSYPTDEDPLIFYFDKVSTQVRFRFHNDNVSGNFYMKQFVVYGTPRESRGI